jgi:uncharacterized protein
MLPTILVGLATGLLLGAVGGGGSILLVPLLAVVFGVDVHQATGTALGVVAISATLGAVIMSRRGSVRFREAAWFALPGMFGAAAMTPVNALLPEAAILAAIVVLMVIVAIRLMRPAVADRARRSPLVIALVGLAAGGMTGLLGVGGGFVVVPALVLAVGLPMGEAVATSLAVIVANSLVAFAGYAYRGDVDLRLMLALAAGASVGVVLGGHVGRLAGERRLQQGFAALLVVAAAATAVHEVTLLSS